MLKSLLSLSLLLATIALIGCSSIHTLRVDQGVLIDKETLTYLQQGLTQEQVKKLLGSPANVSSFQPLRWEYVFQSNATNFAQDKLKKLTLNFDPQGYLINWSAVE